MLPIQKKILAEIFLVPLVEINGGGFNSQPRMVETIQVDYEKSIWIIQDLQTEEDQISITMMIRFTTGWLSYYSFTNYAYDFSSQRMLDLLFKIMNISMLGTKNLRLEQMMRSRLLPELTVVINTCVSWLPMLMGIQRNSQPTEINMGNQHTCLAS